MNYGVFMTTPFFTTLSLPLSMTSKGWIEATSKTPTSKGVYLHFGTIHIDEQEYYIPLRIGQAISQSGFRGRWMATGSGSHKQAFMAIENNDAKYIQRYPNYANFFDQLRKVFPDTELVLVEIDPNNPNFKTIVNLFEQKLISIFSPVWEMSCLKNQQKFNQKISLDSIVQDWCLQNIDIVIRNEENQKNQLAEHIHNLLIQYEQQGEFQKDLEQSTNKHDIGRIQTLKRTQRRNITIPAQFDISTINTNNHQMMTTEIMLEIVKKVGMVRKNNIDQKRGTWYFPENKRGCKVLEEDGFLVANRLSKQVLTTMLGKYTLVGNPKDDFSWRRMTVADFITCINSIVQ